MQRFIPLSYFKPLYVNHTDLLSDEGMAEFLERLNGEEGQQLCRLHEISESDLNAFRKSLEQPTSIVFYGWISYNTALLHLLSFSKIEDSYEDTFGHLLHQLSEEYQRFLSPYLADRLVQYGGISDTALLAQAFSFVVLLDDDYRATIENQLFKSIQEDLRELKSRKNEFVEEQDLVNAVKPLCSEEIIDCVNLLSRASYSLKLEYVDTLLEMIRSKACTVRFANWLLKRMELVQLNREHLFKIHDLRRDLKSGELGVKNHGKGRTPIRWKNTAILLFFVIIAGGVFYLIYAKPFSEVTDHQFTNNSSFKQFTQEERKQIDSLLQEISGKVRPEDEIIDQGVPLIGSSSSLILRVPFANETLELIYEDLLKDDELKVQGHLDSCAAKTKFTRRADVTDLATKKGTVAAMMRNDSEYDVILYIASTGKNGAVASFLLKKGDTKTFEFSKGEIMLLVAGNEFQAFNAPTVAQDLLPSKKFTHHFCETDANYRESINTAYRLADGSQKKVKFLVTGDQGGYFQLLDLKNVLEEL